MKKILYTLVLIFGIHQVNAQSSEDHALYLTNELNIGNYIGLDLHANYVLEGRYSFKLGYSGFIRSPKNAPYDYSSGFVGAMTFGLLNPFDQLGNFQIAAGKIYLINEKGTIRANISVGLGYTTIKEPRNWQPSGNSFVVENYTYKYEKYNTLSLIINPKIEFPISRFFGFSVSPMLQINKDRTYVGIGFGTMMGLLRKKN